MAEYPLIEAAINEAQKLASLENELWQLVEKHKYKGISKTEVVVKDENGKPKFEQEKDKNGQPVVDKDGKPVMKLKIRPEGEAFILQIDDIVFNKSVEEAQKFLSSNEMKGFFKNHPGVEKGYKAYVDQYAAIEQQSTELKTVLKRRGLGADEAVAVSDKIIELVDALYAKDGAGAKGFDAEKIVDAALKEMSFSERAVATLDARDMLRGAAIKDGVTGSISVQDVKTLTADQLKKLDVDGGGLSTSDLDKIYAGFSNNDERAGAVQKLAGVLSAAGVKVAGFEPPSSACVPQDVTGRKNGR